MIGYYDETDFDILLKIDEKIQFKKRKGSLSQHNFIMNENRKLIFYYFKLSKLEFCSPQKEYG